MMTTLRQVRLTCDLCGDPSNVQTQTIGLDGKTFEIDLCPKDDADLSRFAAGYITKARKVTARRRHRRGAAPKRSANATGPEREKGIREKGIFVYGILPADIEVAAEMRGLGEQPGPLRIVRSHGLAALISELEPSGRLGTPDDLNAHREILDGTATEVPVVPLRFGTILASEDAVADELLAAHHDEFADALAELDGRVEFVVHGRYAGQRVTPSREEATRALVEAMRGHCVASVEREPADERDGVHVAFLVDADQERDLERVIENLARDWDGQIELELLGPTAAYDFVETVSVRGGLRPS
jgi:hypothetical protein